MSIPVSRRSGVVVFSSEDGRYFYYHDLDSAIKAQPYHSFEVGPGGSFVVLNRAKEYGISPYFSWNFGAGEPLRFFSFYSIEGGHIDPVEVVARAEELSSIWKHRRPKWSRTKFVFRDGPVSGLSRFMPSHRSFFRRPKTTQEKRRFILDDCDEELKEYGVKLRRRRASLPEAWDDIPASDQDNNTWKRQRKTQWKPKPLGK